jgi:hypothetical protein
MKSLYFVFVFLFFCSLGRSVNCSPEINGSIPFVVSEIKQVNTTSSKYYCKDQFVPFFGQASIILPSGMYNIGDTIQISKGGFK